MKEYCVTLPIAGHMHCYVEADSPEEAKQKAFLGEIDDEEVEYEMLERFHEGNVSHCPSPWEVEVREE